MSGKGNKEKNIRKLLTSQSVSEGGYFFKSVGKESTRRKGGNIEKTDRKLV